MRMMSGILMLSLLATSQVALAKGGVTLTAKAVKAPAPKVAVSEDSAALSRAARDRNAARERAWDARARSITRGVCTGC